MSTASLGTLRPVSPSEIYNVVVGEHGSAAAGNPNFLRTGGKYVDQPTAVASGRDVVTWRDERGYRTPHYEVSVFGTVTTGASASTGISTGSGFGPFKHVTFFTDVTLATGAVATLNVLIDTVLGASGTWVNIAQSTIYTATGGYALQLTRNFATQAQVDLTADAGAGTLRNVGWGDKIRIRKVVTGTATTSVSATVYVSVVE